MKRLIALLAALCCLAALLTPVWAVQDEGTGADSGETGAAATDTGDTAEDPDASGEGGEDATDSAASDSETDQETDPEADQAADAETDSETGSDPAALTETAFQSVTITCTVDESGRAYFQETLELSIVGSVQEIAFTFPAEAKSPKVDGYKTKSSTENGVRVLTVSNDAGFTGVQTFQLSFNQTGLVTAGEASQTIRLPLLSPQAYPIAAVSFSVTFPENFSSTPSFESGYYKDVIEDMMTVSTSGGVVTGITNKGTVLNDNETLTMSLTLPEGYFSGNFGEGIGAIVLLVLSILFALLGLFYWFRLLRNKTLRVSARSLPPDGVNPGDLPFLLAGGDADFNMLVSYWASLGYVSFFINQAGHVIIRRRMEMGNERRAYERKLFLLLFGDESYCDGASLHYKKVGSKAMTVIPRYWARRIFDKRSGSPFLAQLLCCLACACSTTLAMDALAPESMHFLFLIASFIAGFAFSYCLQKAASAYYLNDWVRTGIGVSCGFLLLLVGLLGGAGLATVIAGGASAFVGWQTAHGGRRKPEGDDIVAQTLGFRRFLLNATDHHAQQMLRRDPQYFYKMLPYAEAMGQGRRFTALFHGVRLETCPWYEVAKGTPTTPAAFYDHYCETLAILNVSIRK